MAKKKTPTNPEAAAAAINLDDDEEFVKEVSTQTRVRREKRMPAADEPETIDAIPELDDDLDDDAEAGELAFSRTSLAALIYDEGGEAYDDQLCSILVRRKPDTMKDRFVTPCSSFLSLPQLQNLPITTEQADIEETVREQYGGGHYVFQIRFAGRLQRSWNQSLSDLPEAIAAAKAGTAAAKAESPHAAAHAPAQDPLDSMLNNLAKMKALKEALFGDEQERYERDIAELKAKLDEKPEPPAAAEKSETQMLLDLAKDERNAAIRDRIYEHVLPTGKERHWIGELAELAIQHGDKIMPLIGGLFGTVPMPTQQRDPMAILRGQAEASPIAAVPAEPKRAFRRPPAEPLENDNAAIDAELTTADTPPANANKARNKTTDA